VLTLSPALLKFLDAGLAREWLVTNGLGGYAMGTVAGVNTRRYHGLLVAALAPPGGRMVLVAKVDETLQVDGRRFELGTNEYHDGTIAPEGYAWLAGFSLSGTIPTWTYRVPGAALEKSLWMARRQNTTYARYRLLPGSAAARLSIRPFLTERDYHGLTRGDPALGFAVADVSSGIRVQPWPGATPYTLRVSRGAFSHDGTWYWKLLHREERARGLDAIEDLYVPGVFEADLEPGDDVTLVATAEPDAPPLDGAHACRTEQVRQSLLLKRARGLPSDGVAIPPEDGLARRLVLAADQFLVRGPSRRTIIAGYPWFGDWGRDTMIALPGLALTAGREREARQILQSYAATVDGGMVPNRFSDYGGAAEYTSADAALWYFQAVHKYLERTGDRSFLERVRPALRRIIDGYTAGTRHGIRVDPEDHLLEAGEAGLALTWMDARIDGRPVTPRLGKPVELNAAWYNALRLMSEWSDAADGGRSSYAAAAEAMRTSFLRRFTRGESGHLYDVIGPDGRPDASIRPNQLLSMSLAFPVVCGPQARRILDAVTRDLLTPYGLRTLAPGDANYRGRGDGPLRVRDEAYHQGMVWTWWLGPYVTALLRSSGDRAAARRLLWPFRGHLLEAGLGTVSEIFDGDSPHTPRGCIAQAWSVGALLEAWELVGGADE
jgi:predicted glycogen debranching enzyme